MVRILPNPNGVLGTLKKEESRLSDELSANPVFQKLQAVRKLIQMYETAPAAPGWQEVSSPGMVVRYRSRPAPPPRQRSATTLAMEKATVEFLRKTGKRQTSGAIYEAISGQVKIGGKAPNKTLASFLSDSDLFDNVKGEGYGLVEWKSKNPASDNTGSLFTT